VASKTSSKSGVLRRTTSKSLKKAPSRSTKSAGAEKVSIDRRRTDRRDDVVEMAATPSVAGPQLERRKKVNRRRQIDPTTCERDYTDQEVEFMNALDDYKRKSGRMFPTCSEVLEVLRGLGYVKLSAAEVSAMPVDDASVASAKPMPNDWQGSELIGLGDEDAVLVGEPELAHWSQD
jgi:hypothetical protein